MYDYKKIIVQLRGELGELINSWLLYRHFCALRRKERTDDPAKDMKNRNLNFLIAISDKLRSEIIARLAELASKVRKGRLTFENGSRQLRGVSLDSCRAVLEKFQKYVEANPFEEKRNNEISHKNFVAEWKDELAPLTIADFVIVKALALALRVMKRMDHEVYGEIHSEYFWKDLRKKRYELFTPAAAIYMIAEHINLPESVRARIVAMEIAGGKFHQELMDAEVNGTKVQIYASKKWGAINLGGHLHILPGYPLISIAKIDDPSIIVDPAWKENPPEPLSSK